MSIKLMSAAFSTKIPTTQKFVFVALCDAANDQGECYPSVRTLCEKTSLKDRAVRSSIKWLVDNGFMVIQERKARSNFFYIKPVSEWKEVDTPCIRCTPALDAPLHEMHTPPAPDAVPPLHEMHTPPAPDAGSLHLTVKEPSIEPKGNQSRRASRLSPDWKPSQKDLYYCKSKRPDIDPFELAERFRLYWLAESGAKARKMDWHATWCSWVLREKPPQSHSRMTYHEQAMGNAAKAAKMLFGDDYDTTGLR